MLVSLVIGGCAVLTPSKRDVDRSFLTDEPCPAPCWYGAMPGQTGIHVMSMLLEKIDFVDPESVIDFSVTQRGEVVDGIQWACTSSREFWCGRAFFTEGELSHLVRVVEYHLTIEMAADKLGEPQFAEHGSYASEILGCRIYVFWPERGVIAMSAEKGRTTECERLDRGEPISPDLTVMNLIYAAETVFERDPPAMCCTRVSWPGMQ